MTSTTSPIDPKALDSLSVAPPKPDDAEAPTACDPRQNAGQDKSIERRLENDPSSADAQLDCGLDESMDASDPPSATQPGSTGDPAPSSGYDEEAEKARTG